MKKQRTLWLALALALVMLLAACGPAADDKATEGGTPATDGGAATETGAPATDGAGTGGDEAKAGYIRTNNTSEPGSLDPALAQGTHESWVLQHTFEGLMTYDKDGQVVPGMAEAEPVISEDGLTYTFTIKDGMKWSNGDPVTAHDFEFAWRRVADPDLAADYAHQVFYIVGMEEYFTGQDVNGDGKVATYDELGVKALDDKTLEVKLNEPTGYFTELTAFYTYYPVNKAVVEANPDWAKNPETHISNGPFKMVRWDHSAKIILDKNPEYHDAANIKIEGIDMDIIDDDNTSYQKYDGGEYDIVVKLPPAVIGQMVDEKNPEMVIGKQVGTYYYNLNSQVKPFNNVKVRQAFAMALDRETITSKISKGGEIPAEGVVPFGLHDEKGGEYRDRVGNLIQYNPEEAKKLLDEGLAEEGMDVSVFNDMALLYNTSETHKTIAQAAQEMWRTALGINIGLENVDFQVKLDREKAGDYQISRAGWIGDYADPMTMLELWYSTSSFNDAKYNNPEYDKMIDEVKASNDQAFRMEKMAEAEKLVVGEMPVVPVYFYTQPYLVKPNIEGVFKTLLNYPTLTYAEIK